MANEETIVTTDPTTTTSATTTALGAGLGAVTDQKNDALTVGDNAAKTEDSSTKTTEVKVGAPEAYEPWKLPDGHKLDPTISEAGSKIFKELNLPQEAAQKLVDFFNENSIKSSKASIDTWMKTRSDWREGIKSDPNLGKLVGSDGNFGPDSPLVVTVNRALDGLQNPKLVADFKDAMELTGAGDNPAFVKVLHALASKVTEGTTYVQGRPSAEANRRPSPGAALYPSLPSGA